MATQPTRANQTQPARRLTKVGVGLILLGVLGFLFLRSVRGTHAQPYTLTPASLRPWSLSINPGARPHEPLLVWRAPPDLTSSLFGQLFKRSMESMGQPVTPGIPLLFQSEFDQALANHAALTPEAVLAAAREAGLDAQPPQPICIGHRRLTNGSNANGNDREQLYFVLFDAPAFGRFRARLAELGNRGLATGAAIDPAAASPALILALIESTQEPWLPLRADAQRDCLSPIAISAASN